MSDSTSTYAAPTYAASMPRSQIPTPSVVTGADPKPKTFLLVADQTYPVLYEDHSPATNVVSDVRPSITVALLIAGDASLAILKTAILGGTVNLLLAEGGRTITMNRPQIDSFKFLDEVPSMNGSRIGVLKLSCDSRFYRST